MAIMASKMVPYALIMAMILLPATSFEVFFSCGSDDKRTTFTDHLYTALTKSGIRTFRENEAIPVGENIGSNIKRAIYESKVSVVVFSKDYSTSRRCLDELVMIMERKRKTAYGFDVVPVYFHMDPAEVWERIGTYGEAFAEQEKRFKEKMERVGRWKNALKEVADLKGLILSNRYESQFGRDIVEEIENKLNHTARNRFLFTRLMDFVLFIILLLAFLSRKDSSVRLTFGGANTGRKFPANLKASIHSLIFRNNGRINRDESIELNFRKTIFESDVYLSFRGIDTLRNFIDHLYMALVCSGIHTFREDYAIQRGENIDLEVGKLIYGSKISIIVFSKNYASSIWCLNELAMIMEHRRTAGLLVLPVYYCVDPYEVRMQTGRYGEAFAKHEELFKAEMQKVERWRAALKEVADLRGMAVQDGCESQIIECVVKEIRNELKKQEQNQ